MHFKSAGIEKFVVIQHKYRYINYRSRAIGEGLTVIHAITCTLCRQPSYVNRSQRLNFKCNIIFSTVLFGLFDQTCVDVVISIIYSLLGNIVCTIQEN